MVSSNPSTVYWMNIFHIYLLAKLYCVFEKTKINEKEAGVGPFKKYIFNKSCRGLDSNLGPLVSEATAL